MRVFAALVFSILPTWALATSDTSMIDSRDAAVAYIEKHQDKAAPDGFTLRLGGCDTDQCLLDKATSLIALKGAYKKDYGDQRNLAYCLTTGCDNAVIANASLGCAWRIVILAGGSSELDASDQSNFKKDCMRSLDGAQLATAKAQAANLHRAIYKREISPDFR